VRRAVDTHIGDRVQPVGERPVQPVQIDRHGDAALDAGQEIVLHVPALPLDLALWREPSTSPDQREGSELVRIAHPFHPLTGQAFEFVGHRMDWGEDRVIYLDGQGRPIAVPSGWTDRATPDEFVALAHGRAMLRTVDLEDLASLVRGLRRGRGKADV